MLLSEDITNRAQEILDLIASNRVDKALKRLLDFERDFSKSTLRMQRVGYLLSRRYSEWQQEKNMGILSPDNESRKINKLSLDIIEHINNIRNHYPLSSEFEPTNENSKNESVQKSLTLTAYPIFEINENRKKVVFEGKNLSRSYPKFILDNINLLLKTGEITSLIGKNASGKTTLIEIIAGVHQSERGSISYPSLDSESRNNWFKIKSQIAYLPQTLHNWYGISLKRLLSYEAASHNIIRESNIEKVEWIIQRMGLQKHIEKNWSELSTGYKWRFELARALVWMPKLLILDEPLANLDINAQETVLDDIRNLASSYQNPMAVLISSQHLTEVDMISDNTLYIVDGKTRYYGPTSEIGTIKNKRAFEIICDKPIRALENALQNISENIKLKNRNKYLVITPFETPSTAIMMALAQSNINIYSLSDITNTSKMWFYEED